MVPSGWKKGVIEDIAKVSSGGTPSRQKELYWLGGHIPWVTTAEVKFGVITNTEQKITEEGLKKSSAKLFPKDTILMAMYGQGKTRGQVAKLGIEASTNQACAALQLNNGLEVDYYYQYLVSQYENIRDLANNGGQQNLSAGIIKGIHVPIPPLPEQQKIAKILGTWDKAISTTERQINNSKQQKKALMQQLLTGTHTQRKRLLDDSGKPFAGEWKNKLFKNILKLDRGSSPRPIVEYITEDVDGVNWIKIGDTKGNDLYINSTKEKITKEGAKKSRKVNKGEVIISNSMSYGKPYILNIDGYIHDGWFVIRDYESSLDVKFLLQILGSELIQKQYKRLAAGGVVSNISSELVYAVEIDLPTITEQQKIAAVLSNADKEIELLEQQLADLKQEKKALMQQLLTGKSRVKITN